MSTCDAQSIFDHVMCLSVGGKIIMPLMNNLASLREGYPCVQIYFRYIFYCKVIFFQY